MDKVLSREGIL